VKLLDLLVDRPLPVFLATALVTLLGFWCLSDVPVNRTPHVEIPYAMVVVPYVGAAPDDVESEISIDLEDKLAGLANLRHMSSVSRENAATVVLEFEDRTDMKESLRNVHDKTDLAEVKFPDEADAPSVIELSFDDQPMVLFTLTGDGDLYRLREIAKDLKPQLEAVPGVREVEIFGGFEREVQVRADPGVLAQYGLTLEELAEKIHRQSRALPAGQLRGGASDRRLRATGELRTLEEIRSITVASEPVGPLTVRDVAQVRLGHVRLSSSAWLGRQPSVTLIVRPRPGVNTLATVDTLKRKVDTLRRTLPPGTQITVTEDASHEIRSMIWQLGTSAAWGTLLVAAVLFVFFGPRMALLVSAVLPFSLLFTVIGLRVFGMSISNVSLFALILVLGLVVDGAIVVGEAIVSEREAGGSPRSAAKAALARVGAPVVAADLTTIAAFVPMLLMVGVMGQFMSVMPKVVIFALTGSIFVDHLLLPAVTGRLRRLGPAPGAARVSHAGVSQRATARLARVRDAYLRVLTRALQHPGRLLAGCGLALGAAALLYLTGVIDSIFLPTADRAHFSVSYALPKGTPLAETGRVGALIAEDARRLPEVLRTVLTIGDTGALNVDIREGSRFGPEYGRVSIDLSQPRERKRSESEVVRELRARLTHYAGVEISVEEMTEGPPVGAALAVLVKGKDLAQMAQVAQEARRRVAALPSARDVRVDYDASKPEIQVDVDRARAQSVLGITPDRVAGTLLQAFEGLKLGRMWVQGERVDLRLLAPQSYGRSEDQVRELPLRARDGEIIPLGEIAKVHLEYAHDAIFRRDGERTITLRADVAVGASSVHLAEQARAALADIALPKGVRFHFSGETEERDRSYASLWGALQWAVLLIFSILAVQFDSLRQPCIVMGTVPLALVGVAAGLLVTGTPFSFMVFIGIVSLTGIVVNDGIVLIDAMNRLRRAGMPLAEAIQKASQTRFRPVLLTTATTIAGLLPLTLNLTSGGEFWVPLGVTIISGLMVASGLTLFMVPALYLMMYRSSDSRRETRRVRALPDRPAGAGAHALAERGAAASWSGG